MGHKIFVSYKYADSDVRQITENWTRDTVRNYVDELEVYLKDSSDHIYKGESDGEDLSNLSEETIWSKLKDRIYDSTLTIVLVSKNFRESWRADIDQWIPWEVSYSLKEVSRKSSNGDPITSQSNAVLAVVLPDSQNSYSYYTYKKTCCSDGCRMLRTNTLFQIMRKNMFNIIDADTKDCDDGSKVYYGDSSYIISVKWDDFVEDVNRYINKAYELRERIENYNISKEV